MADENPWARAKELNAIHKRLMDSHPHKHERTSEDEALWNEHIPLYEEAIGAKLVRRHDGTIDLPFRRQE